MPFIRRTIMLCGIALLLASCRTSVADDVKVTKNVAYVAGGDKLQQLDIYQPRTANGKLPVLIHIHGGGWRIGDKSRTAQHGAFYAARSVIFVTINYRLSPSVKHPEHAKDCAAAVAWVFKNLDKLGGDKNRVYLSGHSAGAHLVALLGTNPAYLGAHGLKPSQLAGVIPVDTASFDLVSRGNERMAASLIKTAFGTDKDVLTEASPYHNVKAGSKYPPFLVLVTTRRPAAVAQCEAFVKKLDEVGAKTKLVKVPDHTHRDMNLGMFDPKDPVAQAIGELIVPK